MRRSSPSVLAFALLFVVCVAVGLVAAARSRTRAALARGDLATVARIQDRLGWLRLDDAKARYTLAQALLDRGDLDAAMLQLERGLARAPDGEQWAALAALHIRRGEIEPAIAAWEHGFETNHDPRYLHRASKLLFARGEPERAFALFERALSIQPESAMTHVWNANMARQMGLPRHQIRHLRAAIEFEPTRQSLRLQLAWVLATCEDAQLRDPAEAVRLAEALAAETGRRDSDVLDTLAASLAAAGRYDEAVVVASEARDLAERKGDTRLASALHDRIGLYRSGHAYVQPAAEARS